MNDNGKPGFDVITPLITSKNEYLLVNRGWIEKEYKGKKIINVFKNNPQWNFIVKLHPSLESRRHYISGFFRNQLSEYKHIVFDSLSNINSFFDEATIVICDFGSVGGEFSLQTGKRMIYLQVSKIVYYYFF